MGSPMCLRSYHFENLRNQSAYRRTARLPVFDFYRLHFNDHDLLRQNTKVLGNHQQIVQIDDAGDSLCYARLNFLIGWQFLVTLRSIHPPGRASSLCRRKKHHAIVGWAILEVLHYGYRSIAEILNLDAALPTKRFEGRQQIRSC